MSEDSIFDVPDSDEELLFPPTFTRKREQQTIDLSPEAVPRKRAKQDVQLRGSSPIIDLSEAKPQEPLRSRRLAAAGRTLGGPVDRAKNVGETINLVTPDAPGRKRETGKRKRKLTQTPGASRNTVNLVSSDEEGGSDQEVVVKPSAASLAAKAAAEANAAANEAARQRRLTLESEVIKHPVAAHPLPKNVGNRIISYWNTEDGLAEVLGEFGLTPQTASRKQIGQAQEEAGKRAASEAKEEREEREALEQEAQLERFFPSELQQEEKTKEKGKREIHDLDPTSAKVSPLTLPQLSLQESAQALQAARSGNSRANSRPSSRQGEVTKDKGKDKAVPIPGISGNRQTMSAVEIPSVSRSPVRRAKPADIPESPASKTRRGSAQISAQEILGSPVRRTRATEIPESPKPRRRPSIIDIINSPEKKTKITKGKSIEIPESPEIGTSSKSLDRNTAPETVEISSTTSPSNQIDFKALAAQREARNRALQAQNQQEAIPAASFYGGASNPVKSETPPPKGKGKAGTVSNPYVLPSSPPTDAHAWYPSGVVKKTYLKGAANGPETITFEDVIQSTTLVTTVLSSFQWDYEWVLKQLPSRRDHKSLFIIHGKTEEERKAITEVLSFVPLLKLCFPKLEGQVNVMHSKLMLLFHKDGEKEWLRIVVPTGNLTDYDWGDMGGVMENMLFLIDLPKLPSINPEQTFFMQELLRFMGAQDVPENILNKIVGYDFSATEKMAFVHTIGGSILGEEARCTGYPGLATAVKELGYDSGKGLEIDFVTSSLGALKEDFLSALYRAAQGFDGIDAKIKKPATKGDKKSTMSTPEPELTSINPHEPETSFATISSSFRIYFPSSSTVSSSNGGPDCGGTICFQRSFWNAATFPQGMIYDCESVRPGTLMHNKLLLARPATKMKDEEACAWAYLGSANLSESAWGKLVMDRATKQPKLNCRNWECGVILPVPKSVLGRTLGGEDVKRPVGLEAFEKVVPVPMKTPAERVERPWFFTF